MSAPLNRPGPARRKAVGRLVGYDIDGQGTTFLCLTCAAHPLLCADVDAFLEQRTRAGDLVEVLDVHDDAGWACTVCLQPMMQHPAGRPDPAGDLIPDGEPRARLRAARRAMGGFRRI